MGKLFFKDRMSLRISALLLMVVFVLLATAGVAFYFQQNEERQEKLAEGKVLQEELAALQQESARLDQLVAMADQPQYIERIARDKLGMVQADEIVFQDVN